MSIEEASLAVPAPERERFLRRAHALQERARARRASSTELGIALGVLLALCGARSKPSPNQAP